VEVDGVDVTFVGDSGPATLAAEALKNYELRIDVDPRTAPGPLTVQVQLPQTGRNAWPIVDVEVVDATGRPVPVRRGGIEWHTLLIPVPAQRSTFLVHAVTPPGERPQVLPDAERHLTDETTGLSANVCRWYDGRRAAISLRFDDSHPTHLSTVIPILNEYGFRGTFMVNPGGHPPDSRRRSAFEEHRAEWEAVARSGKHEFANHTLHHRGAENDEDMEHQIGQAAREIWRLFPDRSRLLALNLGGGTSWTTSRTLRYYLDRYHQFVSSGSTGMDDVYGERVATLRRLLENHIERGLWYRVHYHDVGEGHATSEADFRAALEIVKEHHAQLWIAGMADIYKYETERHSAALRLEDATSSAVRLVLSCATQPALFDQPLTIEVQPPKAWASRNVVVTKNQSEEIAVRKMPTPQGEILRFDVMPVDAAYTIHRMSAQN
jgi:hypothetical protein